MDRALWSLESVAQLGDTEAAWTIAKDIEDAQGLDKRLNGLVILTDALRTHIHERCVVRLERAHGGLKFGELQTRQVIFASRIAPFKIRDNLAD